jgi:purine-nucleoside phosphorylase
MTEHIEAKKEEIAKTVIMPGDPLRAKMIASKYLDNYKLVNSVRNIYAYTGEYKGKKVTIMASGMGMPSIGIYSYELYKFYDVDNIIRIGTCGAYKSNVKIYDTILVDDVYSDSSFAFLQNGSKENILSASSELNEKLKKAALKLNIPLIRGRVHSSDVFYKENDNFKEIADKYNCLGVEMESFALFHNAKVLNKKAACLLTVSNSLLDNSTTTSEERQNSFTNMIEIALASVEEES